MLGSPASQETAEAENYLRLFLRHRESSILSLIFLKVARTEWEGLGAGLVSEASLTDQSPGEVETRGSLGLPGQLAELNQGTPGL